MKTISISAVLSVLLLCSESLAAVSLKLAKSRHPTTINKRHILPRQNVKVELSNNITGGSYSAQISVGTPPQQQNLALDTGSSDVWFLDSEAEICNDADAIELYGGCVSTFDTSDSSTFQVAVEGGFNISYLDGSGAAGDYITDDISIGGKKVTGQQLGLAHDVTVETGIMGIGFTVNVASNSPRQDDPFTYPSLIDQMFEQKVINLKAYSLYLDAKSADTGSIIFGGYDPTKWVGELFQLPLVPSQYPNGTSVYDHFTVVMTGLTMTSATINTTLTSSSFREPVVLDSGTTLTYLPSIITRRIYAELNAYDDTENTGLVFCDCAIENEPDLSFNYFFGDSQDAVEIRVPIAELVYQLNEIVQAEAIPFLPKFSYDNTCAFGIFPASSDVSLLGDTFLRSAYVVYDISNTIVAMAQTNFNSTSDDEGTVIDFEADATSIPRVSGIATSVEATETATDIVGGGAGGGPRPSATGTGGAAGNDGDTVVVTVTAGASATSTGAAAGNLPPADLRIWAVLGFSGLCAVLGGTGFMLI